MAETKKIVDPRVEIDTSPPFESVKEAVDRFGGSGPWIPNHLLRFATARNNEAFDMEKIEVQAVELERDLLMKEQQTLNVLKELEAAKRFVEGLKLNLIPELCSFMESPDHKLSTCQVVSPCLMFTELNQAKQNLSKTSVDLAAIQVSVESLNKKLREDRALLEGRSKMQQVQVQNPEGVFCLKEKGATVEGHVDVSLTLCKEIKQVDFEAEQFKKMTEASRIEVMKAMVEIERTKNCIRMAEMRLNAAKKMEEAAKAVEAIALAERNSLVNGGNSSGFSLQDPDGITISFQEYQALSQKAKQAEELCNTKFIDTNRLQQTKEVAPHHHHDQLEVPILEKFEETTTQNKVSFKEEGPHHTNIMVEDSFSRTHMEHSRVLRSGNNLSKFRFRNSHAGNRTSVPDILNGNEPCDAASERPSSGFRSTTSIGDVLSRKVIVRDEVMMGRHVENQRVSLSQMLREQSKLILHPKKAAGEGNHVQKQFFMQRKKFGFIQVPIPTKQSKKKGQL